MVCLKVHVFNTLRMYSAGHSAFWRDNARVVKWQRDVTTRGLRRPNAQEASIIINIIGLLGVVCGFQEYLYSYMYKMACEVKTLVCFPPRMFT